MQYRSPGYIRERIIQAKLYVACEKAGLNCDMEYCVLQNNVTESRFDLVIFEDCEILAVVEVKTSDLIGHPVERSAQIIKYSKYNIPVFILYSIYDIPHLVKRLIEVRKKFLESIDSSKAKCFEADKQNKEKWDRKISEAIDKFDETFPDYKFNSNRSLEILATGVRVLGLPDTLKLIDESSEDSTEDFFFLLDNNLTYRKGGREKFLDIRKGTIHTATGYHYRRNQIAEKLK